jgi:hypothetical protein
LAYTYEGDYYYVEAMGTCISNNCIVYYFSFYNGFGGSVDYIDCNGTYQYGVYVNDKSQGGSLCAISILNVYGGTYDTRVKRVLELN